MDLLQQIGSERGQLLLEAGLEVDGTQVTAIPGQIGQILDVKASLAAIHELFLKSSQH